MPTVTSKKMQEGGQVPPRGQRTAHRGGREGLINLHGPVKVNKKTKTCYRLSWSVALSWWMA